MHALVTHLITQAATAAGLPEGCTMSLSASDNLTLVRPRIELEFLPETYTRTGRKLAIARNSTEQIRKKEIYEVILAVTANVLADNEQWLADFSNSFVLAFPKGVNDIQGNWVKIVVQQATFSQPPAKRVGTSEIKVFTKVNKLFALRFTWRVTQEEKDQLINTITINNPAWGNGVSYE